MKVKKLIQLLLMIIIIFCSTISYAVTVRDLYPAAKAFDSVNKVWNVPALVRATGATAFADETVALGLTKAIAGGIMTSLAIAGVGYVANSYVDWLMGSTPSMYYDTDQVLKYNTTTTVQVPIAGAESAFLAYMASQSRSCSGQSTNVVDGANFTSSSHVGYTDVKATGTWNYSGGAYPFTIYKNDVNYGCPYVTHMYGVVQYCTVPQDQVVKHTVTDTYLEPLVESAINNNDVNISAAASAAIDEAALLVAGGAGAIAAANSVAKKVHDQLVNGISGADVTAAQAAADAATPSSVANDVAASNVAALTAAQLSAALASAGLSANQIAAAVAAAESAKGLSATDIAAAVASALAGQGLTAAQISAAITISMPASLTQSQIQAAVAAAMAATLGADVAAPTDPTIVVPDKLSLTAVLTSFMATINSLPMLQTLHGLSINISGATSLLCVNLPNKYGGQRCYDCANISGALGVIGAALLGLTTLFSFMYVFKG